MSSNGEEVRRAAIAELARRELERRQQAKPSVMQRLGREAGLGTRAVLEGGMDLLSPFADVGSLAINKIAGGREILPYRHSEAFSRDLTRYGLPEPQGGPEKVSNFLSRMITGAAAGGAIDKAVMGGLGLARAPAQSISVPSADDLKNLSRQAYQQADNAGVVISPNSFANNVGKIVQTTAKEGLDPTLHPQATAALKRLTDAIDPGKPITFQELETLRKVVRAASGSLSKDERRIAGIMTEAIDDFALNLSSSDIVAGNAANAGQMLRNARNLWSRASKSEVVEGLIERAQNRAGQFSGSGYENAIRTEFRNLVQNPRKLRLFSPVEQQALRRVARGGPVENVLRYFGKLAPTGVVSTALSGGIGAVVGGAPGAVAVPLGGAMARQGATALTSRNARLAAELMRRGAPAARTPISQALAPGVPYGLGATPTVYDFLFGEKRR